LDELKFDTHFCVNQDVFGELKEIELKPGGSDIKVTNENKVDYVERYTQYQMFDQVRDQITAFLHGFYELVPRELISIFNYKELELLLCGLPEFDIADLKNNIDLDGYQTTSP
jgi:hypothetical protein